MSDPSSRAAKVTGWRPMLVVVLKACVTETKDT
jgi:hypothetical protein